MQSNDYDVPRCGMMEDRCHCHPNYPGTTFGTIDNVWMANWQFPQPTLYSCNDPACLKRFHFSTSLFQISYGKILIEISSDESVNIPRTDGSITIGRFGEIEYDNHIWATYSTIIKDLAIFCEWTENNNIYYKSINIHTLKEANPQIIFKRFCFEKITHKELRKHFQTFINIIS